MNCPTCDYPVRELAIGPERLPLPNGLTFCIGCGDVIVVEPTRVRRATFTEKPELLSGDRGVMVERMRAFVRGDL